MNDTVNAAAAAVIPPSLGFGHFIAQSDAVGKTLLAILVVMSVLSWALIVGKGIAMLLRRQRSRQFLNFFWNAVVAGAGARMRSPPTA